jgi:hypothetical protein
VDAIECPSVIDEVARCLQLGTWASNFASEKKKNFSGQLKASLPAVVKSASCGSVLALFPAISRVENVLTVFVNDKCPSGPVTILVDALSGVDQVLRAWRTRQRRYGDLAQLRISWQPVTVPCPTRSRGKVDDSKSHCGVPTLSG